MQNNPWLRSKQDCLPCPLALLQSLSSKYAHQLISTTQRKQNKTSQMWNPNLHFSWNFMFWTLHMNPLLGYLLRALNSEPGGPCGTAGTPKLPLLGAKKVTHAVVQNDMQARFWGFISPGPLSMLWGVQLVHEFLWPFSADKIHGRRCKCRMWQGFGLPTEAKKVWFKLWVLNSMPVVRVIAVQVLVLVAMKCKEQKHPVHQGGP